MIYDPGMLTGRLSGSAGSTVAGYGPAGPTISVATNALTLPTAPQTQARANLTNLSHAFLTCSDTQAVAWSQLGISYVSFNALGRSHPLNGLQCYQKINGALQTIGLPISNDPPAFDPPQTTSNAYLEIVGGPVGTASMLLYTSPTSSGVGIYLIVYASEQVSPGRTSYPVKSLRLLAAYGPNVTSPIDITADYQAEFGLIIPGAKTFVTLKPVRSDGNIGQTYSCFTIAT
jgi:hypothetical protein